MKNGATCLKLAPFGFLWTFHASIQIIYSYVDNILKVFNGIQCCYFVI